jgi:hypothetical protein
LNTWQEENCCQQLSFCREQLSIFFASRPFDLQDKMVHLRMCIISTIKIQAAQGTTDDYSENAAAYIRTYAKREFPLV